jgi:hypothetical protein
LVQNLRDLVRCDVKACTCRLIALGTEPLEKLMDELIRQFRQSLAEIALLRQFSIAVKFFKRCVMRCERMIAEVKLAILFENLVGDLQQKDILPKGGNQMLLRAFREKIEHPLLQFYELEPLRFQVNDDVSLSRSLGVAELNEQSGLPRTLPADDQVHLAAQRLQVFVC